MVQCNRCNLQCIGETKERIKDRFNEHRRAVHKTNIKSKPTTVSQHFLSHSNHSHTGMKLIPLEKIHFSRDSVREAREAHWIDKAMTLEPNGLNHRDELLYNIVFLIISSVTSANLKKAGMASRNIVMKKQYMLF